MAVAGCGRPLCSPRSAEESISAEEDFSLGVTLRRHQFELGDRIGNRDPDNVRAVQGDHRAECPVHHGADGVDAIVPNAPSITERMAWTPNLVASTRSKAVGVPPRW